MGSQEDEDRKEKGKKLRQNPHYQCLPDLRSANLGIPGQLNLSFVLSSLLSHHLLRHLDHLFFSNSVKSKDSFMSCPSSRKE